MKEQKIEALANFLEVDKEEINQSNYNENLFEYGNQEYLVLTDDEADEATKEYIEESVWSFKTDFIIQHSDALDYDEASRDIVKAILEKCEAGNEALKKLIDDMDEFVEDAIDSDGRGAFLATYDSNENEEGEYFIYRTN